MHDYKTLVVDPLFKMFYLIEAITRLVEDLSQFMKIYSCSEDKLPDI